MHFICSPIIYSQDLASPEQFLQKFLLIESLRVHTRVVSFPHLDPMTKHNIKIISQHQHIEFMLNIQNSLHLTQATYCISLD
jgi:hypothetical protein